ncbi:sec24-like protein [Panus rudis PR-1116 ss-1]|nr:sec24-like protein [Panus rudis PR-1116 ss-1]
MYAHSAKSPSQIPQPPHSAGTSYKGLRAAIDPHQIPSPVEVIEADNEKWERLPFPTLPGTHPPLSTSDYIALDQGCSSPKFFRVSTWTVPSTYRLANECHIPLAAVVQPLAEPHPREEPVPLVETGESGPPRCGGCRAYVNPWCTWVANGARWRCNLCEHETEVDPEYYCALDANLLRLDHQSRPELNKGTVDFTVPQPYWAPHPPPRITPLFHPVFPRPQDGYRTPQPLNHIFCFDVSTDAIRTGFLASACNFVLRALYGEDGIPPCLPEGAQIAILTFDDTIQFYNLASHLELPEMLLVADVEEVFLPIPPEGLFVDPHSSRSQVERLLTSLLQKTEHTSYPTAALGSALAGALAAFSSRGGMVTAFVSTPPTVGLGALKPLSVDFESTLYDTEKESTMFIPRDEFWEELGEQCAEEGVGVNMFVAPTRIIDIASIGVVSSLSGGEMFFHPRFDRIRDGKVLESQIYHVLTRTTVYDVNMLVRTSKGLRVKDYHGNYTGEPTTSSLTIGTLSSSSSISFTFEHTARRLDERQQAYFQCAVLYTSKEGQRRVRVLNLAMKVAELAGSVFRFADLESVTVYMLREALSKLSSHRISQIQEELTEKCAAILLAYRRNCAASTSPSQLIIPEAFKALPMYTLAMFKSKPLKARNVTSDVRNYWIHKLMSMPTRGIMFHLYPRLLALHDLDDRIALPQTYEATTENGETETVEIMEMPSLMRDSYLFMESGGLYLIDNEELMVMWIGMNTSPQIFKDVFGVEELTEINRNLTEPPLIESTLSTQIRNIIAKRAVERGGRLVKFMIARQNIDGAELEFSDMLVEDQNNAAMSYLDYLCLVHKQIANALNSGGSISGSTGFRGTPW